jgi:NAD(P)-dependent dehydrogenase (short-subunit alcohol dehydrogenase family)
MAEEGIEQMGRLDQKVAFITGATGGIGAVTCERFVREGASVAVAARSMERARPLAERLGPNAFAVHCELSDEASIRSAIDETAKRFGRLDVLVNNGAGTDARLHRSDTTVVDVPLDVWDDAMSLNLRSAMITSKYAIPHMIEGGGGSIINTSSGSGHVGDLVRTAYGASKAGLMTLTKYTATQYGRKGVRCNAIAPGLIVIDKVKDNKAMQDFVFPHVLTPRLGIPEDIAALALFLASDESGYITGQVIDCDGGMMAHQPHFAVAMAGQGA